MLGLERYYVETLQWIEYAKEGKLNRQTGRYYKIKVKKLRAIMGIKQIAITSKDFTLDLLLHTIKNTKVECSFTLLNVENKLIHV